MISDLLSDFYNQKYPTSEFEKIKPVHLTSYPRDRFEAAVFWARKGDSFLEIASGSGEVIMALKDSYKNCIGVELSESRAKTLQNALSQFRNIRIITGNVEHKNLPLDNESFDTIIMNAVLEHLIEPVSALKYLYSLLKPAGKIIIITPNIAKWTRRIKLFFGRFPSTASTNEGLTKYDNEPTSLYDEGHLHYFTYRSLSRLLKEYVGFSQVEAKGFGSPRILTSIFPYLFSECLVVAKK